jgi:hypothetical protein
VVGEGDGLPVAGPAARDEKDNFDGAAGRAVEEGLFGGVAEADDELREEVGYASCACVSVVSFQFNHGYLPLGISAMSA